MLVSEHHRIDEERADAARVRISGVQDHTLPPPDRYLLFFARIHKKHERLRFLLPKVRVEESVVAAVQIRREEIDMKPPPPSIGQILESFLHVLSRYALHLPLAKHETLLQRARRAVAK